MLLGEVAFVGAAAATSAGPGVAAAASLVGAAADVALSDLELPAKATEKAVLQAEGSGLQSGKVGGAKAKEKEKEENNGKSFSVRPSARPTANPWFNNLQANSRKREESRKKERQAKNEEKEREKAAKAAVDLLGGGKKRKKDADIPPASAVATEKYNNARWVNSRTNKL